MHVKQLKELLINGFKELNLDTVQADKLIDYVLLLEKWNKTYNITAIRDLKQMVILHLIDSASVYRYLSGNSIIDVGTGGGIPGIIFAILNPQLNLTLLDSSQKKTRFLRFVQRQLKLANVTVVCQRVEKFQANKPFDVVISRAFTEVGNFLKLSGHLCADSGQMLAMKGPRIESEKNVQELGFELVQDIDVEVPFLEAQRRLLVFNKL
jgi:16S rRNA (guanine527-N7)-methyltransferase